CMNVGARLGETQDCLVDVDLVMPNGALITRTMEELRMSYRTAHIPPGSIIANARLQTTAGDVDAERQAIRTHLDHRAASQPLHLPSCGSTFQNPPGDHAGRLIEACGLKGYTVGGAQVSDKHANFIVNIGDATADQIRSVVEHVQRTVQSRFNVNLQREVHYAGDWSHWIESIHPERM
ncbi:MAG: UDP-N-acetylmuramate dehydrogenase, partial [Kiritimatiellia bacterium]